MAYPQEKDLMAGKPKINMHRQFTIDKPSHGTEYNIKSPSNDPLFHVNIASTVPDSPDLVLHAGPGINTPVVAIAYLGIGRSIAHKIGLGNPNIPGEMFWEDMARESLGMAKHSWLMAKKPGSSDKQKVAWKKTHSVSVDGIKMAKMNNRNWKLVDEETEEVLAVFTRVRSTSECGILQINVDYGKDFDLMVMMTILALFEKTRRQAKASVASASGPRRGSVRYTNIGQASLG